LTAHKIEGLPVLLEISRPIPAGIPLILRSGLLSKLLSRQRDSFRLLTSHKIEGRAVYCEFATFWSRGGRRPPRPLPRWRVGGACSASACGASARAALPNERRNVLPIGNGRADEGSSSFVWSSSVAKVTNANPFWRSPSVSQMIRPIVGLQRANGCFRSSRLFPLECRERTQCHACAGADRAMSGAPAVGHQTPTVQCCRVQRGTLRSVKLHKPMPPSKVAMTRRALTEPNLPNTCQRAFDVVS
jgi:hypothetical protein